MCISVDIYFLQKKNVLYNKYNKSNTKYEEQGDWSDYEESEQVSVRLLDTDNESNDSEILSKKRKRVRRLINDDSEPLIKWLFYAQFFIIKSYRKELILGMCTLPSSLIVLFTFFSAID